MPSTTSAVNESHPYIKCSFLKFGYFRFGSKLLIDALQISGGEP